MTPKESILDGLVSVDPHVPQAASSYGALRRDIRFVIPFSDPLVLATARGDSLPDFEGRRIWALNDPGESSTADIELVVALEKVRSDGALFLVIPASQLSWLERYQDFRKHLEANYRIVFRGDSAVVFSLRWAADGDFRNTGAPDGLPLPPPELMRLTLSAEDSAGFITSGSEGAGAIARLAREQNVDIASLDAILDYGCGCGRIIRHWKGLGTVRVIGADYNPYLVNWCRVHLPFATFITTPIVTKLALADESVDFIYAVSVLTHLDARAEKACLRELKRVLKPKGVLLLTVHGSTRLQAMNAEELRRFESGELVVRFGGLSGSNACTTFHPEPYIRRAVSGDFELLRLVPGGAKDVNQDAVLLQKRS